MYSCCVFCFAKNVLQIIKIYYFKFYGVTVSSGIFVIYSILVGTF